MAAKKKKSHAMPKGAKPVTLSKKKYMCYSKRVTKRGGGKTSRGYCRAAHKAAPRKAKKK
jgi:hypothetical protein